MSEKRNVYDKCGDRIELNSNVINSYGRRGKVIYFDFNDDDGCVCVVLWDSQDIEKIHPSYIKLSSSELEEEFQKLVDRFNQKTDELKEIIDEVKELGEYKFINEINNLLSEKFDLENSSWSSSSANCY
jgi:hypothetical protein